MYSFTTVQRSGLIQEKHRAKGIQKAASKTLTHEDYWNQLTSPSYNTVVNRRIGSTRHQLYSIESTRLGLSAADDKRFLLPDKIHTLAYGHYKIKEYLLITNQDSEEAGALIYHQRKMTSVKSPEKSVLSDSDMEISDEDEEESDE